MIEIQVKNIHGDVLASSAGTDDCSLCVSRSYEAGDVIMIFSDQKHLIFQPDAAILPGEVYLPGGSMAWPVPAGEHRLAYPPHAFECEKHLISTRAMTADEVKADRNIACSPADLRGSTNFFPHATANAETRGESCFAARCAVDGNLIAYFHGEWPFLSWGIDNRSDAALTVAFGRDVVIHRIAVTLRSDFPHDACWKGADLLLSDGAVLPLAFEERAGRQYFDIGTHTIDSLTFTGLIPADDPSRFCALTQLEAFGRDAEGAEE